MILCNSLSFSVFFLLSGRSWSLYTEPDAQWWDAGHVRPLSFSPEHKPEVAVPIRTRLRQEVRKHGRWQSHVRSFWTCWSSLTRLIHRPDHLMGMEGSMGPPGSQNNLGPANSEGSMYSPSRYPSQQRLVLLSFRVFFWQVTPSYRIPSFCFFADMTATGSSIPACHMECIHLGCIHSNRCKKKINFFSDLLIRGFNNPTVISSPNTVWLKPQVERQPRKIRKRVLNKNKTPSRSEATQVEDKVLQGERYHFL